MLSELQSILEQFHNASIIDADPKTILQAVKHCPDPAKALRSANEQRVPLGNANIYHDFMVSSRQEYLCY
jgi:hypothetical protein